MLVYPDCNEFTEVVYSSGFNNGFNLTSGMSRLANIKGLGAAGHLHGVDSRAEASRAKAHPTTPSRDQDRPSWGSWRKPRDQIIKNVHKNKAGLRSSQELSPWVRFVVCISGGTWSGTETLLQCRYKAATRGKGPQFKSCFHRRVA